MGDDLIEAQAKLDEVNQRLTRSRIDLRRAENALDLQREILAKRAATLYKTGDLDWLDLLSSIQSLADIDTIRSLQRAIADQDRRSENEAQRLAREARRLERQVEQDHEEAVAAAQEVQNQKIELDQKLAERSAILQDVTKRIKKILASGGLGAALAMARNGQFTQLTWARALLVAMRLPVTADNVAAVTAWEMAEGGHWYNTAYYNPLNTTQSMPGATVFNSVGVKAYTSWKQGLEATVDHAQERLLRRHPRRAAPRQRLHGGRRGRRRLALGHRQLQPPALTPCATARPRRGIPAARREQYGHVPPEQTPTATARPHRDRPSRTGRRRTHAAAEPARGEQGEPAVAPAQEPRGHRRAAPAGRAEEPVLGLPRRPRPVGQAVTG